MKRHFTGLACSLCLVLSGALHSSSASAAGWVEVGDAGDLVATAQVTVGPPPLDFISGTIFTSLDKDMYEIRITSPATFSATVALGGSLLDTQLFLFDAAGSGVYANDDPVAANFLSILPSGHASGPVAVGTYYLVVSGPDNDPTSLGGEIFDDVNPGVQLAVLAGAIDGWTPTFSVFGGTYSIDLTGAEFANSTAGVPALGIWGLGLLVAVLGIRGSCFLRSRAARRASP